MRVRGLKRNIHKTIKGVFLSHPMRVRGLKLSAMRPLNKRASRTLCGCVD